MNENKKDKTLTEIALAFYRKQNEEMNNFIDDEVLKEIVEEQIKPIIREWLEQKMEEAENRYVTSKAYVYKQLIEELKCKEWMSLSEKYQTLKEKLENVSYQHGFSKCGNTDVMTCSDTKTSRRTDKDIVKVEDALKIFKEWLEEKRQDFLREAVFGLGGIEIGLEILDELIKECCFNRKRK